MHVTLHASRWVAYTTQGPMKAPAANVWTDRRSLACYLLVVLVRSSCICCCFPAAMYVRYLLHFGSIHSRSPTICTPPQIHVQSASPQRYRCLENATLILCTIKRGSFGGERIALEYTHLSIQKTLSSLRPLHAPREKCARGRQ